MATTTELVELIADDTGLDQTFTGNPGSDGVPSFERRLILSRLNQAYRRLVGDMRLRTLRSTVALTTSQDTYLVGPGLDVDLPDFIGFKILTSSDGTNATQRMTNIQEQEIEDGLIPSPTTTGLPRLYSFNRPELRIWPRPRTNSQLEITYYALPLTLIEDSPTNGGAGPDAGPTAGVEELAPSSINPVFHESVLAKLATMIILRGYEGRPEEAAALEAEYRDELRMMRDHAIKESGLNGPRDTWYHAGYTSPDIA